MEEKHHTKTSISSTSEQDLDAFLLGESDDDPGNLLTYSVSWFDTICGVHLLNSYDNYTTVQMARGLDPSN